ncbi:MAG: YkgJ family cysteine cluster protein [Thermoguttaceae bacterium]
MSGKRWFKEGLRFECTGCGDCCTGAPGYVWVNGDEIRALATSVGLPIDQFEATYVRRVGVRRSLTERDNGDCVLFDAERRRCLAYHARPRQCRSWPFWESTVDTPEDWQDTSDNCPGCGHGRLYSANEIVERVESIRV